MVVASFTQIGTEYEVTLDKNGNATDCTCSDHKYRGHKAGHICKHRINAATQVEMEVERAATFLSLKERFDYRSDSNRRARYNAMYDPCLVA